MNVSSKKYVVPTEHCDSCWAWWSVMAALLFLFWLEVGLAVFG